MNAGLVLSDLLYFFRNTRSIARHECRTHVKDIKVDLSTDLLTLYLRKDFLFKTNKLDRVRPKYEAMLKISLSDSEFSHLCPCKG